MLPIKTSKRNLLTIGFAAFTLVMLVIAAFGAVNYNRFYPAITQIQMRIISLQTIPLLNKVTEVIPSYECTSSGDPAVCDQTGLTLITSSVGGGPGGGGG